MKAGADGWGSARKGLCVLTVLLSTVASSLMQTFLTVSLPTAATELDAVSWYGWIAGVYLATATLFIPPWAIFSDRLGPRIIHVAGMTTWALGTWAVSLSGSITWLLGARAIQGAGAAAVVPAGFAAITAVYPDRYGRLVGLMGGVQASVILAGGPLGGWLGAYLGWRDSLKIVAAVAALPALLGWFALPRIAQQPAAAQPTRLLKSPTIQHAVAQTMLLAAIAFGVSTYLPLLLQHRFHLDLAHTAVLATPTLIGVAAGSVVGGVLSERRDVASVSWLVVVAGLLLACTPFATAATSGSAIASAGVGMGLPAQLALVERAATKAHASKAGGIIQGARNIGGALGVALLGIPLQLGAASELGAKCAFASMLGLAALCLTSTALGARRA